MEFTNNFGRNGFLFNLDGKQTQWSEDGVKQKLQVLGRLNDKSVAWVQSDLRVAPSNHFSKLMWTVVAKRALWVRSIFFNIDLSASHYILRQIRRQITTGSSLVPIFNRAVATFNQIAPQYSVPQKRAVAVVQSREALPDKILAELVSCFSREVALRKSDEFIAVVYNREGNFQIQKIPFNDVDQEFFAAQKLAQQKMNTLYSSTDDSSLIYELKALQMAELEHFYGIKELRKRKEIASYFEMIDTCLRNIEALLGKEAKTAHGQWIKEGISYFFSEIRGAVDLQVKSYFQNPIAEKAIIQGKPHYTCLQERLEKGRGLYTSAKQQFPNQGMLVPFRDPIGSSHLLLDPLKKISEKLDNSSILEVSRSFSNEHRWSFLQPHPQEYFQALCQELHGIESISELSPSLKEGLKGCTYVDIGKLLNLKCIQNGVSISEVVSLFKNAKEMKVGEDVSEEFFRKDLSRVIKAAKTLRSLDLSNSKVRDEDLSTCPGSGLQEINFSQTSIDGRCFSSELFKTVQKLVVRDCAQITDDHLKSLSSRELKEIDLSHTEIDGSFISANAFKYLQKLSIYSCRNVRDDALKNLSCRALKRVDLGGTSITGSCLCSDGFKTVEWLSLSDCENVEDRYLKNISSRKLEKVILSYTNINGSCLCEEAFRTVRSLNVEKCKNISDLHLKNLSSRVLEEITLKGTNIHGECLSEEPFETVVMLNLSECENIADHHLKNLSSRRLEKIDLGWTDIDGSGLDGEAFKTVKILILQGCDSILDEYIQNIPEGALEKVDLGSTSIKGRCLSANSFKTVRYLKLNKCKNLKDKYVKKLSSTNLEEGDFGWTAIDGRCFSSHAFKSVKKLLVYGCENVTDDHLIAIPSRALDEVDLAWTKIDGRCFASDAFKTVRKLHVYGCENIKREYLKTISGEVFTGRVA